MNRELMKIFIIVFFLKSNIVKAQDEKESNVNSNRKLKNEASIEISGLSVVGGGNGGYPSLFYRRHYTKSKDNKNVIGVKDRTYHALRFRIGSNLSFKKMKYPDIRNYDMSNQFTYFFRFNELENRSSFFLRLGKEKQERIGKFEIFYGYDVYFYSEIYRRYEIDISYSFVYDSENGTYYDLAREWIYKNTKTSLGISPIFGFKYFLLNRLCFSGEAKIDIGYNSQIDNNISNAFSFLSGYQTENIELRQSGIEVKANPLYVISMGYYFQ